MASGFPGLVDAVSPIAGFPEEMRSIFFSNFFLDFFIQM